MTDFKMNNDKNIHNGFIQENSSVEPNHYKLRTRGLWFLVPVILFSVITGTLLGAFITHFILTRKSIIDHNTDLKCNDSIRTVTRPEWNAQQPQKELIQLELPATRVIIAATATETCTSLEECVYQVHEIQKFHTETRGWDDIGYNFLVGRDGAAYVGRGWDLQGAHTKGYNVKSICIAFIGTFNKLAPSDDQLCAAQHLIAEGIRLDKLSHDYALYGHRQLINTESPGKVLYNIITTWDHWTGRLNKINFT